MEIAVEGNKHVLFADDTKELSFANFLVTAGNSS